MTATKILALTLASLAVVALLAWIVIMFEPPAFIGYFLGILNGANIMLLLVVYLNYLEEKL